MPAPQRRARDSSATGGAGVDQRDAGLSDPGGGATFTSALAPPGISRSRIFLRSVLRLRPSIAAALIWLPRVAASVSRINGRSTSAITWS